MSSSFAVTNSKKEKILLELICAVFVLLFLYAAFTKLFDYEKFRVQLGQSPLLTSVAGFVAWFIPSVEILISVLLMFSRTRLVTLYAAFSLMAIFNGYIVVFLQFSNYVPCSCSILEKLGGTELLLFNIAFIILGGIGIMRHGSGRYHMPRSGNNGRNNYDAHLW